MDGAPVKTPRHPAIARFRLERLAAKQTDHEERMQYLCEIVGSVNDLVEGTSGYIAGLKEQRAIDRQARSDAWQTRLADLAARAAERREAAAQNSQDRRAEVARIVIADFA